MRTMAGTVVALATFFVSSPARAEVRVGVLGGANFANLEFSEEDPDVDLRSKTFFAAGIVVETGLGRRLSVQLEPMYLQKGGRIEIRDFLGEDAAASLRFSYVELPVLLKFSISTGRVRPYLILGPSAGYRLSAKAKDEVTGEEEKGEEFEENFEKWDFGVGAGGGLSVAVGRGIVFVDGRYTWGLANLNKDDEDVQVKNRGVQVLAGVTFPVGRR